MTYTPDPRCALPVLSFTLNDQEVAEHPGDIRALYLDLMDIIAIEIFDRNAEAQFLCDNSNLSDDPLSGKILELNIKIWDQDEVVWWLFLKQIECQSCTHDVKWLFNDQRRRGPVFDFITRRISEAQAYKPKHHSETFGDTIKIQVDFSQVSAHKRLRMIKTRAEALSCSDG
jgi:hypothetical protein